MNTLYRYFLLSIMLYALPSTAHSKIETHAIAQECATLFRTNSILKKWLNNETSFNNSAVINETQRLYACGAFCLESNDKVLQACALKIIQLRKETGFPLTPRQTPALHACIKKLSQKFNVPMPIIFVSHNNSTMPIGTISITVSIDNKEHPEQNILFFQAGELTSLDLITLESLISHELVHISRGYSTKINQNPLETEKDFQWCREEEKIADRIALKTLASTKHYKAMIKWVKSFIQKEIDVFTLQCKAYAEIVNILIAPYDSTLAKSELQYIENCLLHKESHIQLSKGSMHPSPQERIDYLEKDLAELEAELKTKK